MKSILAVFVLMFSFVWVIPVQASPPSYADAVVAYSSDGWGVQTGYKVHRTNGHHGYRARHGRYYRYGGRYYRSRSYYPAGFYGGYRGRYCR